MFFQTILGNSPLRFQIRRNLVYEDWSLRGSRPAMINEHHVALFEAQEKVSLNDVYGTGEALFARKFSDDSLHLVARIDDMMMRKEKH